MTQTISAVALCVLSVVLLAGCGKSEAPAPKAAAPASTATAPAAAAPASAVPVAEMQRLVEETKRHAQSVKAQAAGQPASAEHLSQLPALLEQLLRHVQEREQAREQGRDVAQSETQIEEDLQRIEQIQGALPAAGGEQPGTPPAAGAAKSPLDLVSENIAKITGMVQQGKAVVQQGKDAVQQGKELVAMVRPTKRQGGEPDANAIQSSEPQASEPQASEPQAAEPQAAEPPAAEPQASTSGAPEQADKEPAASAMRVARAPMAKMPELPLASGCCTVVPNPAMKGRLGRLVVTYPEGTKVSASVKVSVGDKRATSGYGSQAFELLPGTYTVEISGKRLEKVVIQSGHDTRVKVGVLRVTAPGGTAIAVLDADGKTRLTSGYGSNEFGLPVGTVHVQVAGQSEPATIQDGKITEF